MPARACSEELARRGKFPRYLAILWSAVPAHATGECRTPAFPEELARRGSSRIPGAIVKTVGRPNWRRTRGAEELLQHLTPARRGTCERFGVCIASNRPMMPPSSRMSEEATILGRAEGRNR